MAIKKKPAPKLDDQILINATVTSSETKTKHVSFARKPATWVSGVLAVAAIVGITFSMSLSPNAGKEEIIFPPFQVSPNDFQFNLSTPKGGSATADRIWVPEVVAKAGPDLSVSTSGWGPLYEGVSPTSPKEYIKFLAEYFGVEGELTKEGGFSVEDSQRTLEFYQIYDHVKKIRLTTSTKDKGGIGFNISFSFESGAESEGSLSDAKQKMTKLLQDLVLAKSDSRYPDIKVGDVQVTQRFHYVQADAKQLLDDSHIDSGFTATFFENGQLETLSGTLVQFVYKGAIPTVSEKDAITRLGAYWDNPYRVQSNEDVALAKTDYCENNPTMAMKCETTIDKVVRGTSVFYDKDRKIWIGPTYTMFHNGHRVGTVLAIEQQYLVLEGQ